MVGSHEHFYDELAARGKGEAASETAQIASTVSTDFYHHGPPGDADSPLRFDFPTAADARVYIQDKIDVPAYENELIFVDRARLHIYPEQLGGGRFTNVYDLAYRPESLRAKVRINATPQSVAHFLADYPECIAAASGAFLFLADKASGAPRQSSLNLALRESGMISSLPVVDRETLIADDDGLSVQFLQARGEVSIDGRTLTWAGSRTAHEADCRIYGNGSVVINHAMSDDPHGRKMRIRVLDEASRRTPSLDKDSGLADVGLIAARHGRFLVREVSPTGSVDLFAYDAVMRLPDGVLRNGEGSDVHLLSIDSLNINGKTQGAISVGPMLMDETIELNAINNDPSLGNDPPFINTPMVRLALYGAADGSVHFSLFDGRPESSNFTGVTPREAVSLIAQKDEIVWGCFLDPGRTAKLASRVGEAIMSYGNAHYLQWPAGPGDSYVWVPGTGRPIPSAITLE